MSKLVFLGLMVSFFGFLDPAQARVVPHSSERRAAVPALDFEAGCRDVANMDHNRTTNYAGCVADERTARTQLENEWANFPPAAREQCIYLVTAPAIPSYVTLQGCLQLARDAKNLTKSSPSDRTFGNPE
jgi:hypothetical protein